MFTHRVFRLAPDEDSGSETLGRYHYQAEVAARACLAMLTEDGIESVVCEWHEDFVVALADGSVELVSVKHREHDQGPWTVTLLCEKGGLAHLFDRWCACDCAANVRLRLSSNGALKPDKNNAATLARMCGPDPEVTDGLDAMAKTVARNFLKIRWKQPYANIPETPEVKVAEICFPEGFVDKVKRFLAVLEIDCNLPERRFITDSNLHQLVLPAVARLQLADVDVEVTYRKIVERIERANRDEDERGQLAVYIADPGRVRYNTQMLQRIARRRLTREILRDEFVHTSAALLTFPRGQIPVKAPGGERLGKKLRCGRVPSDEAAFVERLRSGWYVTWSQRRSGLAGDGTDLENLSLDVLDVVFGCRAHARSQVVGEGAYGARMNELIRERLTTEALSAVPFNLSNLHLRGLAYQLCDECQFYFSETFDVAEEAS